MPATTPHTPGPWFNYIAPHGTRHILPCEEPTLGTVQICTFNGSAHRKQGEEEANANLISAAPDLMAALVALRDEAVKMGEKFNVDGKGFAGTAPIWAYISDATDAIAKATGTTAPKAQPTREELMSNLRSKVEASKAAVNHKFLHAPHAAAQGKEAAPPTADDPHGVLEALRVANVRLEQAAIKIQNLPDAHQSGSPTQVLAQACIWARDAGEKALSRASEASKPARTAPLMPEPSPAKKTH